MTFTARVLLSLILAAACLCAGGVAGDDSLLSEDGWKRNGLASQKFEIQGTANRNNPLRRPLRLPFSGDQLFVRYRIRYDAATVDTPADADGEFFVLWLDQTEGGDGSTHSSGVPNLGIHVARGENHFMARYAARAEKFGPQLTGDREFLIVGRLWKSSAGSEQPFDQLDLWVDPEPAAENSPDASASHAKAIPEVSWIGFSTGNKTETDDRIEVWDIELARTWAEILGLPPQPRTMQPIAAVQRTIDFGKHVFPILKARCFQCHTGDEAEEGVRLDVLDEVLNQTTPRNAARSRLFQLVSSGDMPKDGDKLGEQELAVLRAWIDEGLDWSDDLLPTPIPVTDHWAFQPIRRPEIPVVASAAWLRTPVDAFVARKHDELGLQPAHEADSKTLSRRMSLDMLGLPPEQTQVAGSRSEIDRLLAHPAYGQRWARHWLDVGRWAESNGHQHNRHRPYAWRYRDWVVDAFNNGKPYDDFIREQIAGDEISPYRDENLVATGFLAAARYSGNELDKDIQRNDILVDIANTTAKAFLGLTLECAQCHTHKFDPISIRDYYRFQAFFALGQPANVIVAQDETAGGLVAERWEIFDSVHARLVAVKRKQGHPEPIYIIPKSVVGGMKPQERARFNELDQRIAAFEQSWSFYSPVTAVRQVPVAAHDMRWPLPRASASLEQMRTTLLIRGDVKSPGPEVQPGWPAVFGPSPTGLQRPRLALANWIASPDNPLTARVWVNRIWQWHFGRGLVETSGDFGAQGSQPTHPELLDFLATELIGSGWSTRHIQRLILDSATYRQSSRYSVANAGFDPDNKFLWRWQPRRLEAEAIRDSILAACGQLDRSSGGPSVNADSDRRSMYRRQRRDSFPHQQLLFDGASGIVSCSRRRVSTTSLQPLWLMNSHFVQQAAQRLAARAGSVEQALQLAIGREPASEEAARLNELADEFGLASACLAILNSSEFLYMP